MKLLSTLLVFLVIVLAFMLYRQQSAIRAQQNRLVELQKQVTANSAPITAPLEYQEKCAEQARKTFTETGYKLEQGAGYENHYNVRLNKCFVLVQNIDAKTTPTIWTYKSLIDAYEGKSYGEYSWHTVKGKKYWEVPPFSCKVMLPSGEERICQSDEEFKELIKVYMEDR